jgi:glucose/arabinose dehydrogenase
MVYFYPLRNNRNTLRLIVTFFCLITFFNRLASQGPGLSLIPVINGLDQPMQVVNAGDGTNRLFVVHRSGTVSVFDQSHNSMGTFLTVSGVSTNNERGLLSMAFHPDYGNPSSNFFFVLYTNLSGDLELARYQVSTGNPNIANPAKTIVFSIPHPTDYHNGGTIHFGADGYLYWTTGDGGTNPGNSQDGTSLLGKMLRIEINTSLAAPFYSVPANNPYVNNPNIRDEIWAMGLRNPFRWSFDRETRDMWIADVGEGSWEEINYRPAKLTGGINYGWPCYEGNQQMNSSCGPASGYISPVFAYANPASGAVSVTGGTVYRGTAAANASLRGYYLAADYVTGDIYKIKPDGSGGWTTYIQAAAQKRIVNFGEAENGELYTVSLHNGGAPSSGVISKIAVTGGDITPPTVSSVTPANNTIGVSVGTTAIANFSEALDPSTVTTSTFQLKDDSDNIVAATVSAASGQIILTPSSPLALETDYTATITGGSSGVKDLAGNALASNYSWSFTTVGDITPPTVSSVLPANGNIDVSVVTTVTANFSEAVDASTITTTTFQLNDSNNNIVAATVSAVSGQIILTPSSPLTLGIVYTATITGGLSGVKDQAGNTLASNYSWSFTTVAEDVTPPVVTFVTPAVDTIDVSVSTKVIANFSEAVDASTVTTFTFQLKDSINNIIAAGITVLPGQIILTPSSPLASGTVYTATITGGPSGVKDLAGNALAGDYSWSFTTATAAPVTYNIFPFTTVSSDLGNDGKAIEVGVKFRVTQAGYITGVRFYKKAGNTGTYIGHLWSIRGTQLAEATFINETTSGWQEVLFNTPVAIDTGTTYVASYFSSEGFYNVTRPYFTSAVVNGPVRALADAEDKGGNGVFRFSTSPVFPNYGNQASNFWVDVIFSIDVTPPIVSSVTPANDNTGVIVSPTVIANFSEKIDSSTVTSSAFQLKDSSNNIIAAAVSVVSDQIILTPLSPLALGTVYTATITGGTSGVKDLAGNALAGDYSWSFTTAMPVTFNIFPTVTPDPDLGNDGRAIEVGVKFRVTQPGYITGVRFYKKAGNTGTHIGHLWSSKGTQLAEATFINETASGWQEVLFNTPVAIDTGTTYVASYFSSLGHYNVTRPYFKSAVINGPVRALADGEDGGNGVFKFSKASIPIFPTNTTLSNNFWVDVIFTTGINNARLMTKQSSRQPMDEETSAQKMTVKITPNPSAGFFRLTVISDDKAPVSARISDISGRVLEQYEKVAAGSLIEVGKSLRGGTYFAEIRQGNKRKVVKIIKVN